MATKRQRELYELIVHWGLPLHLAADIATRGRLNTAEIKVLTKVLKHVIPITGRVVASEIRGAATTAAGLGRLAIRGAPRAAMAVARTNPYALAATLLYLGYIKRDEIAEVGAAIADDPRIQAAYEQLIESGEQVQQTLAPISAPLGLPGIRPLARLKVKRKISKANRAVKEGMRVLKAGGKAVSGTAAGILPKGAFKTAVKAAGRANPNTKSKIGKGKSIMNKLARRLKKWW